MGAKLLLHQQNAKAILSKLVKEIPLPITCKIRYYKYFTMRSIILPKFNLFIFFNRIFDNVEDTIHLARALESTGKQFISPIIPLKNVIQFCSGIQAIAVHGRTAYQKSTEPVDKGFLLIIRLNYLFNIKIMIYFISKDTIRHIAENLKIPVIANGGSNQISSYDDIEKFKKECGASSVMVARSALKNMSIFRKEGEL